MEFKKFGSKYVVRLDKDDEIMDCLKRFSKETGVTLANISGIGACSSAVLGVFDYKTKTHIEKEFTGHYEILSLIGNITASDKDSLIHLHICLSGSDYSTIGGHLHSAIINIIGEIFITPLEGEIHRIYDETVGCQVLKF